MGMFCYQCQEAAKGTGCTKVGVCGKTDEVANLQDLLLYVAKGVSVYANIGREQGVVMAEADKYVFEALFITITNANFSKERILAKIKEGFSVREAALKVLEDKAIEIPAGLPVNTTWKADTDEELLAKSGFVGILTIENEDIRSLKELLVYGVKGMAAYAEHAFNLGYTDDAIFAFMHKALVATTDAEIGADALVALNLECGKYGVDVMALLDKANTESYGNS